MCAREQERRRKIKGESELGIAPIGKQYKLCTISTKIILFSLEAVQSNNEFHYHARFVYVIVSFQLCIDLNIDDDDEYVAMLVFVYFVYLHLCICAHVRHGILD